MNPLFKMHAKVDVHKPWLGYTLGSLKVKNPGLALMAVLKENGTLRAAVGDTGELCACPCHCLQTPPEVG